jgi:sugar-specific transcriptional regulator TrmB
MDNSNLKILGFNAYETKIINVLLPGEVLTVREIYTKTKIPKNKIYETLETLKNKGIIGEQSSKPKKYFILNDTLFDNMISDKEESLAKLKKDLEDMKKIKNKLNPYVLSISEGDEEIHRLVEHSNTVVQNEILSCSRLKKLYYNCYRTLKKSIERGVKAKFVALYNGKNFDVLKAYHEIGAEIRIFTGKTSDFPKIGIFDEKFTRITIWPSQKRDPHNYRTIWANSPILYKIVKAHFDKIWEESTRFDPKTFKK